MALRYAVSLLALPLILGACTPPAPPVTPSSAPAKPAPPPPSAPPSADLPLAPAPAVAPPALPVAAPITEPLPPLTRPFTLVTLPKVNDRLVSVSGRSDKDIFFVTDEEYPDKQIKHFVKKGALLRYDGKRVVKRIEPDCYGLQVYGVMVDPGGVILTGSNPFVRAPSVETAILGADGKWKCHNNWTSVSAAPGDEAWALTCRSPEGHDCSLQAARGRKAPFPAYHPRFGEHGASTPQQARAWQMRGHDDGWMVLPDEAGKLWLWRWNGVSWTPKLPLDDLDLTGLWSSREGMVWLVGTRGQSQTVVSYDGRAARALPVPEAFDARMALGVGDKEIWFLGGERAYQLVGQRLHEGPSPFRVSDAWVAPSGEMWAVSNMAEKPGIVARVARPRGSK